MREKKIFLQKYQHEILEKQDFPVWIKEKYRPVTCLKERAGKEVWIMEDKLGVKYILKVQDAGDLNSLKSEYEIVKQLASHGVGTMEAVCCREENGKEYFIRTYVKGRSLYEIAEKEGPFSEARCVEILLSLCKTVRLLHEQKPPVIHRDIKPQNVILTPDHNCVLIDYGAARRYREEQRGDTVCVGTPDMAPPEQFGYGQTDERADIYSIGMLLRYMLTGNADKAGKVKASLSLRRLLRKSTAFDPKKRFRSAKALYINLKYIKHRKIFLSFYGIAAAVFILIFPPFLREQLGNTAVSFESTLLEQAVRQELKLAPEEPIQKKRLKEVKQLIICGNSIKNSWEEHEESHDMIKTDSSQWNGTGDIRDLKEITLFPELEVLVLDYQNIEDFSPIKNMNIRKLSLCGNRIKELAPLSEMKELTVLWIEENPITDTKGISGLSSLTELEISNTDIKQLTDFCGLPLVTLKLRNTKITDATPLKTMTQLRSLWIGEVDPAGMEAIQLLTGLRELFIAGELEDLEGFGGMKNLEVLDISNSDIRKLDGVENLSKLTYLGLGYTKPESLVPLEKNRSILQVEMVSASIADYTPLRQCPNIIAVHIGFDQEEIVRQQLAGSGIKIHTWEG